MQKNDKRTGYNNPEPMLDSTMITNLLQSNSLDVLCSVQLDNDPGLLMGEWEKIQKLYIEDIELHGKIYSYVQLVDKSLDATQ